MASSCSTTLKRQSASIWSVATNTPPKNAMSLPSSNTPAPSSSTPSIGEARFKLAETYERLNNIRAAFPEYIRAADALPDDRKAQIKATQVLLLSGQFEDAKARAAALLAKNPKDVEILLLYANSLVALRDPAGAMAQIEEALKVNPKSSPAFVNLGVVRMRSGEAKEAEAAFRKAIELEPASVDAKLALANFLWAAERAPEAEATLKEALAKEPQHLLANRMLAVLYLSTRRTNEAEQPLKVIADVSKTPAARFQLADYYAGVGRSKDAVSLLTPLSADPGNVRRGRGEAGCAGLRGGPHCRSPQAARRCAARSFRRTLQCWS